MLDGDLDNGDSKWSNTITFLNNLIICVAQWPIAVWHDGQSECGTVGGGLSERSACNVMSSSLVRDSYCVYRDLEQFLHKQLLCNTTGSALPRCVSALPSLRKKGDIKGQFCCIVLYAEPKKRSA